MKHTYYLTLLLLFLPTLVRAEFKYRATLDEFDKQIERKYIYKGDKDRRIQSLKFSLNNVVEPSEQFDIYQKIFEEYKTYQYDSTYVYATKIEELAENGLGADHLAQSSTNLLYCYTTVGFFKEGAEIIANFKPEGVSCMRQALFYVGCAHYYQNLRLYIGNSPMLVEKYKQEQIAYTEKALAYMPEQSFQYQYNKVQIELLEGENYPEVAQKIETLLATPNIELRTEAIMYSWLSTTYNLLGDSEMAIYYVALSAIADIEACTYETTASRELANYMYELGDIKRASKYIRLALDDANEYNTSFRKLEIQAVLPSIADTRYETINSDRILLSGVAVAVIILLILVFIMFQKIKHRNKWLRTARKEILARADELTATNEQLFAVNEELAQINKIKDQYIIQSLYGDSAFVDNVETISKTMLQKIKAKQYSELRELITHLGIKQERTRMSSAFDSAFLKLFPNFVTEYNKLFPPECALSLDEDGSLSPEVRIFALIRLGITDINKISKYLNLSPNTIYVYRAKVKTKTIVPKEEFEAYIMRIN